MEKLKEFCHGCLEDKKIVETIKDSQGQIVKLSSGYKNISDEFVDG